MTQKPPQETTGYLLAQACKLLRARAHALLGGIGLYRGQQFVLRVLWEKEGLTHSELAEQSNVRPATITNTLKRMEKAGFVERRQDAEDQRVSRVYLTDAGRNIRDAVEGVWSELEGQAFAGFSSEERILLSRFLLRIRENLMRRKMDNRSQK
jgi:DNA-binding MarR family transcriptional regulator